MFVIREVFKCKPGKAKDLVKVFKKLADVMKGEENMGDVRIMTDYVADYWTVVTEWEVETLDKFAEEARTATSRPEVAEVFKGYMELIEGGHREIWKIE
jgi:heme-degrading monooxygenase HmoA